MTLLEPPPAKTAETPPEPTMDDNIISVLSEAMDSDEDVELTAEMLAKLSPATHHSPSRSDGPTHHSPPATNSPLPPQQQSLVLPLILLVFAIILLAVLLTFFIL
jgi:hypothetical protein